MYWFCFLGWAVKVLFFEGDLTPAADRKLQERRGLTDIAE